MVNHLPVSNIDLGFAIRHELNHMKQTRKVKDTQILKFKQEVQQFLIALCDHILKKSPLKYHLSRCLRCLSPSYMVDHPESSERLFKEVLELLVSHQRITGAHADEAMSQYRQFVSSVVKEHL